MTRQTISDIYRRLPFEAQRRTSLENVQDVLEVIENTMETTCWMMLEAKSAASAETKETKKKGGK